MNAEGLPFDKHSCASSSLSKPPNKELSPTERERVHNKEPKFQQLTNFCSSPQTWAKNKQEFEASAPSFLSACCAG